MKQKLLFVWLSTLLTACSTLPPAIKNPPAVDISYNQALRNIDYYTKMHSPVRWGGTIIDVENEQEFSLLQVLAYPLSSYGRPEWDEPYEGRFLVKSSQFLDPSVYTKGKGVTVAGIISGKTEHVADEQPGAVNGAVSSPVTAWIAKYSVSSGAGTLGMLRAAEGSAARIM